MHIQHSQGSYEVVIERGALPRLTDYWPLADYSKIAVVTTKNLWERLGPLPGTPLFIPTGEEAKELRVLQSLWDRFYQLRLDTRSLVIALGGGTVGDVAGFAAATFMRGVDIIQVPTTLVGMVDSAIGGKTGLNYAGVKNGVGAMHHPVLVLADPNCLTTLPPREMASGMAEAIKSAVIGDPILFEWIERDPYAEMETLIRRSAAVKAKVVNEGVRDHLNYGHTFGHALESLSHYTMAHGEAVSIGMSCAARLSLLLGKANEELVQRQNLVCKAAGLPIELPDFSADEILRVMRTDKKSIEGRLRLVLPEKVGKVSVVEDVPESLVLSAIESLGEKL